MAVAIAPNYCPPLPPPVWTGVAAPAPSLDSWSPGDANPGYSFSFPPLPWNAWAPAPSWSSGLPTYPISSYTFSPIDYTLPREQFPDTTFTQIFSQPSFPSTGFYTSDPGWTQKITEESIRENAELEKQRQDSQAAGLASWNRNWQDYTALLGKQLDLDGKPLKG